MYAWQKLMLRHIEFFIRRRNFRWWSKFNYVLSAALDSGEQSSLFHPFPYRVVNRRWHVFNDPGTLLSLLFIFFTLQFPKDGTISVNWWGNSVFTKSLCLSPLNAVCYYWFPCYSCWLPQRSIQGNTSRWLLIGMFWTFLTCLGAYFPPHATCRLLYSVHVVGNACCYCLLFGFYFCGL